METVFEKFASSASMDDMAHISVQFASYATQDDLEKII
jgi:hypothetical protein